MLVSRDPATRRGLATQHPASVIELRTLLAPPRSAPGATSNPVAPGGRSADSLRRGFAASGVGRTTAGPRACAKRCVAALSAQQPCAPGCEHAPLQSQLSQGQVLDTVQRSGPMHLSVLGRRQHGQILV